VVHPQSGEELQQVQDLLALAETSGHPGQRAELHSPGGDRHQVRADPVELHQQYPDHLRTARGGDAQQFLGGQAISRFVEQR